MHGAWRHLELLLLGIELSSTLVQLRLLVDLHVGLPSELGSMHPYVPVHSNFTHGVR